MIEFIPEDESLTIEEIDRFIENYDVHRVFSTRHRWRENFESHFKKLIDVKQIVTFREDGNLIGLCSWALVDKQRKQQINKTTWDLPDNVVEGDIIYIDVCLLKSPASIYKIKKFLERKLKPSAKEVYWFNSPGSRVFRQKFKGGVPCQIAV